MPSTDRKLELKAKTSVAQTASQPAVYAKGLMYELKKIESYLRVNLLGPGPSSYKKIIYRAAVSQRLGNTGLNDTVNGSVA
jgi:hypothetical protein